MSQDFDNGNDAVISLAEVKVVREQGNSRFELQIPSFDVLPGQFVAVTGESGCGKSTLLDLLALVLKPEAGGRFLFNAQSGVFEDIGKLWHRGKENKLANIRREHLGYVPQSGGLLPFLSLGENACFPPRLNFQNHYKQRIQELSVQLGIDNLNERMPQSLSGGQRQRAAILRAMSHQPKLILADEPTAAVDSTRASKIMQQFHEVAKLQNTAIVLVTHDEKLVQQNCDVRYGFSVDVINEDEAISVCGRMP